jgi:hypothetical protein
VTTQKRFNALGPGTMHAWNADGPQSRWRETVISWTISGKTFDAISLKDTRNLLILALKANRNSLGSLGFT